MEVVGEGATLNPELYWPYFANGGSEPAQGDGTIDPGTRHAALARLPGDQWLRLRVGWVEAESVRFVLGTFEQVPIVLIRGLWLLSLDRDQDPLLVTGYAEWNSWQWDPGGGTLWYRHFEASPPHSGYAPVSRLVLGADRAYREHSRLSGDLLAAPIGGSVLIREELDQGASAENVYILDSDGAVHPIARQCSTHFTDSYRPFGGDAAWSPDGKYVVLKDRTGELCEGGGTTIYDRHGVVSRDLPDPQNPYLRSWHRDPGFADQVGTDSMCRDVPPGVELSERRNRCQWSPDRDWFATMPGVVEDPHLGELVIYAADGTLVRRFLIVGWPCNTFQWSPDSQWLAYGGPSGCA
ncbi:MAG: hypothetical protein F4209_11705 [Chloroflexi bacterium]|nr:hypothetical protein [Chloroflexota bacterium]